MIDHVRRSAVRRGVLLLALVLVAAGAVSIVVALRGQESAPRPPRSIGRIEPPPASTEGPGSTPSARPRGPVPLGPSRPVRIRIGSVEIDSVVNPIGLAPDGTLAVPQPGPRLDQAAWFQNSPSPGQPGPSIIEGHVDSAAGPSVFFRLGDIRPGDRIEVWRADGVHLVFTVDAVRDFLKSRFPTRIVYGGRDLATPQLRLITCSDFDESIRHHVGNEVVFSHLTSVTGRS